MKNDPSRPDPDQLLKQIQLEDHTRQRGHLKIFLGYAAGVGKTFAMLEAAHQRLREGIEVVVGYVETHGRAETEAMLAELVVLPRAQRFYRGILLAEMDVDAVLARRPQLALVDELAHTNAPGSRHTKRYQDVEELLLAGIDVYTTLNIQHLASLNDVVAQITGITVRETIPDSVIDGADEIELTDLPPEELLVRLREGKVYVPEQAARAVQKFFRKGNLTALRELTFRRAAERVDDQMRAYMETLAIPGPWPAAERLLVCVSPNSFGERLVRSTRRLADEVNAEWMAVYIEAPAHAQLPGEKRDQIARTLRLAEELGARSLILPLSSSSPTIAGSVLEYARQNNVTKIIVGKPLRPLWIDLLRGSIVDQLIRRSGDIDVFVISSTPEDLRPSERTVWQPRPNDWLRYLYSLLLATGATGLGVLVGRNISPTNLVMGYLLVVVIAALYLGRGPAILTSIVSVLAFDFFFVPPQFTFTVYDTEYLLTFAALLAVGLVISYLTVRAREQAEAAERREADASTLYELSRELSFAEGLEEIVSVISSNLSRTFGREVVIFLPKISENNTLEIASNPSKVNLDDNEYAVAVWAFQHGQSAGRGTETLTASSARYTPLKTPRGVIGVLGIKPKDETSHLTPDQRRLLETFSSQAALAIERALLAGQAQQTQLLQATEKLQTALLNSISHDLRTPLVSITGALSSLAEASSTMDADIQLSLLETALEEADRMNRLVGNLLNMTRLEAGALQVLKQPGDVQDAIGTALENLAERVNERKVLVHVPENIPLIPMDFVLIVQVLVNLIDNSLKYSSRDQPIEIQVDQSNKEVTIHVSDRGVGIPASDLERIFDKFYRVQQPENVSGTGLGLSISKGIVEAHGGRIWAENRPGGGTILSIALPLESMPELTR